METYKNKEQIIIGKNKNIYYYSKSRSEWSNKYNEKKIKFIRNKWIKFIIQQY